MEYNINVRCLSNHVRNIVLFIITLSLERGNTSVHLQDDATCKRWRYYCRIPNANNPKNRGKTYLRTPHRNTQRNLCKHYIRPIQHGRELSWIHVPCHCHLWLTRPYCTQLPSPAQYRGLSTTGTAISNLSTSTQDWFQTTLYTRVLPLPFLAHEVA